MKKITNNYYLLLINLKITRDGYVTHKPSKSLNPLPFALLDMVFLFSPVIYETFYLTG